MYYSMRTCSIRILGAGRHSRACSIPGKSLVMHDLSGAGGLQRAAVWAHMAGSVLLIWGHLNALALRKRVLCDGSCFLSTGKRDPAVSTQRVAMHPACACAVRQHDPIHMEQSNSSTQAPSLRAQLSDFGAAFALIKEQLCTGVRCEM